MYKEDVIISIKPVGIRDVWDIEVEGDHSYVAGGMIHHNSTHVMQTIPSRETKEYREQFISRPGNNLIIADYSQQEIFIGAYLAQDERLMEICNGGQDIYMQVGSMVFQKTIEDKHDPLRKVSKDVVLGMNYGMTEYGLADKVSCSAPEAAEIIFKFRKEFPQHARWSDKQRRNKTHVETEWGRKCWLNVYSGKRERNALNSPVQGTAADMMKRAIGLIRQRWDYNWGKFGLVAPVHDEAVFDVPSRHSDEVAKLVETTMVEVGNEMCPGMKFKAEAVIGTKWSDKS